jgi:hypothetical protein
VGVTSAFGTIRDADAGAKRARDAGVSAPVASFPTQGAGRAADRGVNGTLLSLLRLLL